MALTIQRVQDARVHLGPNLIQESFLFIPGTSDYVTGGYVITAAALGFKAIQSADTNGQNATAIAGWQAQAVFALASVGGSTATGYGAGGYTQMLWYVYVITTGVQVTNGGNLAGNLWEVTVQGY